MPVQVLGEIDDTPIWIGVDHGGENNSPIEWSLFCTRPFSLEFDHTDKELVLIALKKNATPFVSNLSSDQVKNGITVVFPQSASIFGKVFSETDGKSVQEGQITVQFDEKLDIPTPDSNAVFSWVLEDEGTFDIRGIPIGEHTLTIQAHGYMPKTQTVTVHSVDQSQELEIVLTKAYHLRGRVVDYKYGKRIEHAAIEVISVSPPDSQTSEGTLEYDDNFYFTLGPFADNSVVELIAKTDDGLRSRMRQITVPSAELVLDVYDWASVMGSVQDAHTGGPVTDFNVVTYLREGGRGVRQNVLMPVADQNGRFRTNIADGEYKSFGIAASGYTYWLSQEIDFERIQGGQVDLGVVALEPTLAVKGRVFEQDTGAPIQGAKVFRADSVILDRRSTAILQWNAANIRTTTDASGEFTLDGFTTQGNGIAVTADGYVRANRNIVDVNVPIEIGLDRVSSISGQVVSLTGTPVPARIHHIGTSLIRWSDGNFRYVVGAGSHQFIAYTESGKSKVTEVNVEIGQSVDDIRLVIEIVGHVIGTMTGLLDGETARVAALGVSGSMVYDVSNGNFELRGVPEGEYVVQAQTSYGRKLNTSVVVDRTFMGHVELRFEGSSSLSGKILAESVALSGYTIQAFPEDDSRPMITTQTGRDGSYRFRGLVDGKYLVEIPDRNIEQYIVVQGDTYADLHVSAHSVYGKLVNKKGLKIAGVLLSGNTANGELRLWSRVSHDGYYRFGNVVSGTYTIQVFNSNDKEIFSKEIVLESGQLEETIYLDDLVDGSE